jgi:DNA-binding Lrp family transcriptional regulator
MSEPGREDRRILDFLRDSVASGESYLRSRTIAEHLGLSSKQVGARLQRIDEEAEDIEIEKWGRSRSTTWRVTPG